MRNSDRERQEILRRLDADEGLLAETRARIDAAEEERRRKIHEEIDHEQSFFPEIGLLRPMIAVGILLLLYWISLHTDIRFLYAI